MNILVQQTMKIGSPLQDRVIANRDDGIGRARALVSALRDRAAQADEARSVPAENVRALNAAGLFRIASPKAFGGSQLGFGALVETAAIIASGCGSTGWIYGVLAGHNWMVSLFPEEAQREVFGSPDSLVASVVRFGGNRPARVPGGYRIQGGAGKFCSGIDHADWVMLGVGVETGGVPEARYLLVPKAEVEVVDDWFTSGLRGTGSRSLRVRDAFVPEHRSVAIADMARGTAPGALYHDAAQFRAPFPQSLPLPLAGIPIGIARAALEAFTAAYKKKIGAWADEHVAEQSAAFMRLGEAYAEVDGAEALLLATCTEIDALADGTGMPMLDRARHVRNIAHAAHRCRTAVNSLFEASGGSAIYDSYELQRLWRDINAAAAHNSFVRERAATNFGRAALGLPPSKFDKIGH